MTLNRKLAFRYGFQLRGSGGVRDAGHDGGGPGENGGLRILNDGAAVVVVLSNVAPTWRADKLCRFIAARIDLPNKASDVTPAGRQRPG